MGPISVKEFTQGLDVQSGEEFAALTLTNGQSNCRIRINPEDVHQFIALVNDTPRVEVEEWRSDPSAPVEPFLAPPQQPLPPEPPMDPLFQAVSPQQPEVDDYSQTPQELLRQSAEPSVDPGELSSRVRGAHQI